jgi:hypothetical protein
MTTAYIKRNYCYDKDRFSLYEPIQVPKDAIFVSDYKENYIRILASDGKIVLYKNNLFAKSFTPNDKNILLADYEKNPRFVETFDDYLFPNGTLRRHLKCEVLVNRRGIYTLVKCEKCGTESPLAMNSMILTEGYKNHSYFNCK